MLGSISGSQTKRDQGGRAITVNGPQRGDVVDVDEDTGRVWIEQRMAELAESDPRPTDPPVEAAAVAPTESNAATNARPVRR
jgi:hypothetical protein